MIVILRWLAEDSTPISGGGRDIFAWIGIVGSCLVGLSALAALFQRVPWLGWPFRKIGRGIKSAWRWVHQPTANMAQIRVIAGRMDAMAAENTRGFETLRAEVLAGQEKIRGDLSARMDRQTDELRSHTEVEDKRFQQIAAAEDRRFERIADVLAASGAARRPDIIAALRRSEDPADAWWEQARGEIPPG